VKVRKIPMRMCSGCGESKPKAELVRVVRSPQGEIGIDLTGKKPGRGAYLCRCAECLKKARKSKRIDRSLETSISAAVYDALEEELVGLEQ
jgi:predicted RNA-binding protein YlxR (DUF448 family)